MLQCVLVTGAELCTCMPFLKTYATLHHLPWRASGRPSGRRLLLCCGMAPRSGPVIMAGLLGCGVCGWGDVWSSGPPLQHRIGLWSTDLQSMLIECCHKLHSLKSVVALCVTAVVAQYFQMFTTCASDLSDHSSEHFELNICTLVECIVVCCSPHPEVGVLAFTWARTDSRTHSPTHRISEHRPPNQDLLSKIS